MLKGLFKYRYSIIFVLAFFVQDFYLDVGFALKAFFIVVPLLFLVTKNNKESKPIQLFELVLIAFYLFEVFSIFFSLHVSSSLRLIKGVSLMTFIYILTRVLVFRFSKIDLIKGIQYAGVLFSISSILLYLYSLINNLEFVGSGNGLEFLGITFDRGVPRLTGSFNDPNVISFYALFFLLFYFQKIKEGLINKIGFVLILMLIVLTVSRSFILAIAAVVLYNIVINYKSIFTVQNIIVILLFLIMMIGALQIDVVSDIIEKRTANISSASGRVEMWQNMWLVFKQSPIYGSGAFTSRYLNISIFNNDHYTHNTYLGILIETGVIGFVLFTSFLTALYLNIRKKIARQPELAWMMSFFIGAVVFIFTLSALISEIFILFIMVYLRLGIEEEKEL